MLSRHCLSLTAHTCWKPVPWFCQERPRNCATTRTSRRPTWAANLPAVPPSQRSGQWGIPTARNVISGVTTPGLLLLALQFGTVGAGTGRAIALASMIERRLSRRDVCLLTVPDGECRLLQCPSVRVTQFPRIRSQLVHRIEMSGRQFGRLSTRKEDDARDSGRDGTAQCAHGRLGHVLDPRLPGAGLARDRHARLEQHTLEQDPLPGKLVEDRPQDAQGDEITPLLVMVPVHEDLGFDNWDKSSFLCQGRIARKGLGIGTDTGLAGDTRPNSDDGTPLGEPRAQRPILGQPFAKAIQSLCDLLTGVKRQLNRSRVDLDAGDDSLLGQQLGEQRSTEGLLANCFVI